MNGFMEVLAQVGEHVRSRLDRLEELKARVAQVGLPEGYLRLSEAVVERGREGRRG